MQKISGKVVDYGLDQSYVPMPLFEFYPQKSINDFGVSVLTTFTKLEIDQNYPQRTSSTNLMQLIHDELKFERLFIHQEAVVNFQKSNDDPFSQIGYLNRVFLYLVDKMVLGTIASL